MPFTNFCCRSGGSNLNAGTLTGDTTEPGTGASFTYASGTWVAGTGVFTVASGDPASDGVAVNDFASVYANGATVTGFVGRITARDATTITVSLAAKSGTAPTDGTGDRTLKVGGAWAGPASADVFPSTFATSFMTNAAGDPPRVNYKNDQTHTVTATVNFNVADMWHEGYTSSYGDGGRTTFTSSSAGVNIITMSGVETTAARIVATSTAGSGSGVGFNLAAGFVFDCVASGHRGNGFFISAFGISLMRCEAYGNNTSGGASSGGFGTSGNINLIASHCIAHDNTGHGFYNGGSTGGMNLTYCIADTNTSNGFTLDHGAGANTTLVMQCDAYNNTGDGLQLGGTSSANMSHVVIMNCNFIKNGAFGLQASAGARFGGYILNCGFGAGTMANTSGATDLHASTRMQAVGSVTYANDVTPWVDPDDGDFRINLAAAKNAGYGAFTQTQSGYGDPSPTVGYPDIGAGQHVDAGGGGGGGIHLVGAGGLAG